MDVHGDLIVSVTAFANNSARLDGGGLENEGVVTVDTSTFVGNTAARLCI
jgi:predicted outer membrane repeat protein